MGDGVTGRRPSRVLDRVEGVYSGKQERVLNLGKTRTGFAQHNNFYFIRNVIY